MADVKPKKLTVKQLKVLQCLLTGASIQEAATRTGTSRDAIYQWMNLPVFSEELRKAENEIMSSLTRSLTVLGEQAINTLSSLLEDDRLQPGVKVKAANVVLTNILRMYELAKLEERVIRLEEELNQSSSGFWSGL